MLAAWLFGTAGFAGFNFLIFLGQKMIGREGALVASIIAATMPMLGLLVNWAVGKAKPSIYSFLFIPLSFCGVALVVTKGHFAGLVDSSPDFRAAVLMIIGASCWVIYTFGATFYPKWSPLKYTDFAQICCGAECLLLARRRRIVMSAIWSLSGGKRT